MNAQNNNNNDWVYIQIHWINIRRVHNDIYIYTRHLVSSNITLSKPFSRTIYLFVISNTLIRRINFSSSLSLSLILRIVGKDIK